jgi:hypothetical protein
MTAARNLKFPGGPTPPSRGRGFTLLDNETDFEILGDLPSSLLKVALFLIRQRYTKRGSHWGEVAVYAKRSQPSVARGLADLAARGLAESRQGRWFWTGDMAAGEGATSEADTYSDLNTGGTQIGKTYSLPDSKVNVKYSVLNTKVNTGQPENSVLDSEKLTSKYVTKLTTRNTTTTSPTPPSELDIPETEVGGEEGQDEEHHNPSQDSSSGSLAAPLGKSTGQGPETLARSAAAGGAGSEAYSAALRTVQAAGLLPDWGAWVGFCGLNLAGQRAQIVHWAAWVTAGHVEALRREAREIPLCNFNHPFKGLQSRMERQDAAAQAATRTAENVKSVFGEATCQPGEQRVSPDGQVWTVAYVDYGVVYFDELNSPIDQADRHVAKWPLAGA